MALLTLQGPLEGQKCHEACGCRGRHPYTDRYIGSPIVSKRGVKSGTVATTTIERFGVVSTESPSSTPLALFPAFDELLC